MRKTLTLLILTLSGLPAAGQTPMTADEFQAYVTGRTLTYGLGGVAFGIEEYLPGRRVRWSYLDGDCQDGIWYPVGEMICFAYEAYPEDQCWSFYLGDQGLIARFMNDPEATQLYETRATSEPLVCLGPQPGV